MKKQITVSIILPFYNGQDFVNETLVSIRNQTFSNFEVVIVDDGSTKKGHSDYLKSVVNSFGDPRFKYMHKENGGLSDARNFGIKNSKGTWIAFIDQDDVWDVRKLEKQVTIVNQKPDVNVIITDGKLIGEKSSEMKLAKKKNLTEGVIGKSYERLLKGNFALCSSIVFKKTLIDKVGYCNTIFKICPDYEFIIRLSEHTDFYFISENLVSYRIHGSNTVKNRLKMSAEVILLLGDRKTNTKKEKLMATWNLLITISALTISWLKKLFSMSV